MQCEKCKKRSCRLRANHWRLMFFSIATGKQIECRDFEPAFYHGLEDVYL